MGVRRLRRRLAAEAEVSALDLILTRMWPRVLAGDVRAIAVVRRVLRLKAVWLGLAP